MKIINSKQLLVWLVLLLIVLLSANKDILAQKQTVKKNKSNKILSINKKKTKPKKSAVNFDAFNSNSTTDNLRPIDGAFIQLWSSQGDKRMWHEVLEAMKTAKMRTIVIQYLQHRAVKLDNDKPVFDSATGKPVLIVDELGFSEAYEWNGVNYVDPTEYILQFAENNNMQVYVGLIFDKRFVVEKQWDDPRILDLEQQTQDGIRFVQKVWDRYGNNPATNKPYKSFAGWYIPSEMWNQPYSEEQITGFRTYFSEISKKCKTLAPDKSIAVSPFLNPATNYLNAKDFAAKYSKFLKSGDDKAGIDIVMLQDSVGAKRSEFRPDSNIESILTPFYTNLRTELKKIGVTLWANVESYESEGEGASEFARLEKQIQVADKVLLDKKLEQIVAFDFFHYMNPFGHLHSEIKTERPKDGPEYVAHERQLYCDYLSAIKISPPKCVICSK
jgi:hypothetical protein